MFLMTKLKSKEITEYSRILKSVLKSKLSGKNTVRAIDISVLFGKRYGAGIIPWTIITKTLLERLLGRRPVKHVSSVFNLVFDDS